MTMHITRSFARDAHVENGDDCFSLEDSRVARNFYGDYTIAEVEALLADMKRVQEAVDALPVLTETERAVLKVIIDKSKETDHNWTLVDAIELDWMDREKLNAVVSSLRSKAVIEVVNFTPFARGASQQLHFLLNDIYHNGTLARVGA